MGFCQADVSFRITKQIDSFEKKELDPIHEIQIGEYKYQVNSLLF